MLKEKAKQEEEKALLQLGFAATELRVAEDEQKAGLYNSQTNSMLVEALGHAMDEVQMILRLFFPGGFPAEFKN